MNVYPYITGSSSSNSREGFYFETSEEELPFELSEFKLMRRGETTGSPEVLTTEVQSRGIDQFLCIGSRNYVSSIEGAAGPITIMADFSEYLLVDNAGLPEGEKSRARAGIACMLGYDGYVTCEEFDKIQERGSQTVVAAFSLDPDAILRRCRELAGTEGRNPYAPQLLGALAVEIWNSWWLRHRGEPYVPVRIALPGISGHATMLAAAAVFLADEISPRLPSEALSIMSVTACSANSVPGPKTNSACFFLSEFKGEDPSVFTLSRPWKRKLSKLLLPLAARLERGEWGGFVDHLHEHITDTTIRADFDLAWRLAFLENLLTQDGDETPANAETIMGQAREILGARYKLDEETIRVVLFPAEAAFVARDLGRAKRLSVAEFGQCRGKLVAAESYRGIIREEPLEKLRGDYIALMSLYSRCADGESVLALLVDGGAAAQTVAHQPLQRLLARALEKRRDDILGSISSSKAVHPGACLEDAEISALKSAEGVLRGCRQAFEPQLNDLCIASASLPYPDVKCIELLECYTLDVREYQSLVLRNLLSLNINQAALKAEYAVYLASRVDSTSAGTVLAKWAGDVGKADDLQALFSMFAEYINTRRALIRETYSLMYANIQEAMTGIQTPLSNKNLDQAVWFIRAFATADFALQVFGKRLYLPADPVELGLEFLFAIMETGDKSDETILQFVSFLQQRFSGPMPGRLWESAKKLLSRARTEKTKKALLQYYEEMAAGLDDPDMRKQMGYLLFSADYAGGSHRQFTKDTKWHTLTWELEREAAVIAIHSAGSVRDLLFLEISMDKKRPWMSVPNRRDIWNEVLFDSDAVQAESEITRACAGLFAGSKLDLFDDFLALPKQDSRYVRVIIRCACMQFRDGFNRFFDTCGDDWQKQKHLHELSKKYQLNLHQTMNIQAIRLFTGFDKVDHLVKDIRTYTGYYAAVHDLMDSMAHADTNALSWVKGILSAYIVNVHKGAGMSAYIALAGLNLNFSNLTATPWGEILSYLRRCAGFMGVSKTSDTLMACIFCNLMSWLHGDLQLQTASHSLLSYLREKNPLLYFNHESKYREMFRFLYGNNQIPDQGRIDDYRVFGVRIEMLVNWLIIPQAKPAGRVRAVLRKLKRTLFLPARRLSDFMPPKRAFRKNWVLRAEFISNFPVNEKQEIALPLGAWKRRPLSLPELWICGAFLPPTGVDHSIFENVRLLPARGGVRAAGVNNAMFDVQYAADNEFRKGGNNGARKAGVISTGQKICIRFGDETNCQNLILELLASS